MKRAFALVTAGAVALAACDAQQPADQPAADGATNAAAPAETAAADDHQYGPAPDALPPGAELAVLDGDPGKEGPFTIRLRFPAGYSVPAHWHPMDETVTVVAGNVSLGMGDKLDRSAARSLGPGGFIALKARQNHYAFTDGGGTIQVAGQGPFQTTYVNPADDPRNKKTG